MDLIGPIIEIFKCVCPPLCKYVQYHRKLDDKMNDLKRELQGLNKKKQDIEVKLSRAKLEQGKKPSNEVNHWLGNVERIDNEVKSIEKEVNKRKYFARARLGKNVEEKIQEVEKYHHDGRSFTAENLVSDDPPTSGRMLPTTETLAGKKTEEIVEEIWVDLMGDKVSKIGVWGMGGIERLPATESKEGRAAMILGMLKAKGRFVLILDDMWEAFRLEEVGIPEPSEENGCKLVITTRFVGVCRSMECKEVRVQTLSKEEALNLFLDKVGNNILEIPTLNKEIINSVVEECAGLPLAIVTVAGCMRGVDEIHEWRNVLNELRGRLRSLNDVDTKVFGRLEFSYHRLKDEKLQQCFLYCALYPEDFPILKEELIDYWIAEGFIEEVEDVQAKNDRGHTILNRLVNCCLLERAEDGSFVKMHDLIRDMALRITSKSPLFMVKAGLRLLKFPGEQEWEENLERVSLMENGIEEIPSNMSPHCDILSTLLLQRNENLQRIPECFFAHMYGLKVLNLSFTNIEVLPSSVSDLTNLRSLLLGMCENLERVPSLAKLLALQYLDLEATWIEEVPEGMEMLENLSHLYLSSPPLKKFPTGILSEIIFWE
ncbi:Disease resistance protein [Citrus sinensis]|uniref:Disease resistance protein n=1 Tax=Citrus sinensis TaxID=2711 RepID=A0ACB8JFS5_CITSI|nr:Disease resistance protein [Citrus sinensis]